MFAKILYLMAAILVFSACEAQADITCSRWIGGDGGLWADPGNWDPHVVPDNKPWRTFAVTISTAERTRVVFSQDRTIDQLDCYGDVDLEIGTATLSLLDPNGLTNYGSLEVSGAGIEHEIAGNVTNTKHARINITYRLILYGQFVNDGQVFAVSCSELSVNDGSLINGGGLLIYNGDMSTPDILENTTSGVISGFGTVYGGQLLVNKGTICASSESLVVASAGALQNSGIMRNAPLASLRMVHIAPLHVIDAGPPPDVNNFGKIEVNAEGGVACDCNLINQSGAIIDLLGGTLAAETITQSDGATFEGFGGITGDVVIDPNGIIKLTGPTNVVGEVNIPENATLEISDGTTLITGYTTCNGTIRMKGGRVIPQGGLSGDCDIIWEPGTYVNAADFNLDGRVNFNDFADLADMWLWHTSSH